MKIEQKTIERFWSKVNVADIDDCWEWRGAKLRRGYGVFVINGKHITASRVAWEISNNQIIPDKIFVCHHCDNPPCCNPKHLFLGSNTDNMRDAKNKNRTRGPSLRGEKHPKAKLTNDNIKEIRRMRAEEHLTYREISEIFKINLSHIGSIINRKSWKHIE